MAVRRLIHFLVVTIAALILAVVANRADWSLATTAIVGSAVLVVIIGAGTPLVFSGRSSDGGRPPRGGGRHIGARG